MDEDIRLINSYKRGDDKALKEIIDRNTPQIYNFVRHLIKTDEANDITQEIFIKVWKNLHKFDENKSSFKTWIFIIARNKVIDFARKKKSISFSNLDKEEENFVDNIKDEELLPDDILQKLQEAEVLNSLLEKLPEQYQTVLLLHYHEEMTFDEISKVLKKPLNTVKSHHYRAILQLRDMFLHQKDHNSRI